MSKLNFTPEQTKEATRRSELCKKNLVPFRHYFLNNGKDEVEPPAFHFDWSDILLKEKDNFAIEGFRESGKGQIVLRAFPLYCLRFPSKDRDYIVLIKQNATLASSKLLEIENEYLSNPLLCSNVVKINQQSASVFSVDVKDAKGEVINIRIEAYGKGSSIRGLANIDRRPRICHEKGSLIWEGWRLKKVEDTQWKKSEVKSECLSVRVHGIPYAETVTKEHLFWCYTKQKKNNKWGFIKETKWKRADALSLNDYIGQFVYSGDKKAKFYFDKISSLITERDVKGKMVAHEKIRVKDNPVFLNDFDFWWVVGLWWGDGTLSKNRVTWYRADKYPAIKNRLIDFIKRNDYSPGRSQKIGCEAIVFSNTVLHDWLIKWKEGNSIKIPPSEIMDLNKEQIIKLIEGYIDSAGWRDKGRNQVRVTSINYEGLLIVSKLLTKIGVVNYIRKGAGERMETFPNGYVSKSKQKYDILISDYAGYWGKIKPPNQQKKIGTAFIEDSFLWRKVKLLEDVGEKTVIPIQTDSHTYQTPIGLSHNCLLDDPQDTEDSKSDTVLDGDWRWFLSDIKFLGQHTRIFLIGNNLGEKCIVERAFQAAQELGFQTRKIAVLNEQGEPNWPEKFSLEAIDKERESFRKMGQIDIWMREKMCEATSAENRVFNRDDFIRYSPLYLDNIIKNTNLFFTVDPASSVNKSACYRAICVNCVTEDNRWIIVDFPYGRWGSDVFIDKLFEAVIKWTPHYQGRRRIPVGIEKGHFKQILEPFIYKEMQRRNIFFDIVPIEHASIGSKLERVKMLAPRFKAHTIMFPEVGTWLAELETELMGVCIDGFKSLFCDLVDALCMQQQIAKPPVLGNMGNGQQRQINEVTDYCALQPVSAR